MQHYFYPRRPLFLFSVAAIAASFACSSGGLGTSCAGLGPIPGTGWYQGPKTDDSIAVRLSPHGVTNINNNWQALVDGGIFHIPVPCSVISAPVIGDFVIADQGGFGCGNSGCGQMDGVCDKNPNSPTYDLPADVPVQIQKLTIQPSPPDTVTATVQLVINAPPIYIDTVNQNYPGCLGLSGAQCSVDFKSSGASPPYNQIAATVKLAINQRWDKLLSFSVTNLNGTEICGSGANPPDCIGTNEVSLNGQNVCGGVWCGIANFGLDYILPYIAPIIQGFVMAEIGLQSCEQCGGANLPCMQLPGASSTCNFLSVCADNADTTKCVPRLLGIQGRLSPAALLGKYGVPPTAQLDLSVAAGSAVTVDQGVSLSTRAGIQAVGLASCVPSAVAPVLPTTMTAPNFDGEAPDSGTPYDVAFGVSEPFMNLGLYEAQQSGALCLDITSAAFGIINTGTFKTFLPSLGLLATRDGKDAPMLVALRPQTPPTIVVGKGTYDPVTKLPIDPLLTVTMKDLSIDFYAMFDDKYAKLFSLTMDIDLPLSLIFSGCSTVEPAIGNLQQSITNIRPTGTKILAEDPKVLGTLIPAILGFAQPALANLLKGFTLPSIAGFTAKIDSAQGVQLISGTSNYNYLAMYAGLVSSTSQCATAVPTTIASLKRSIMPNAADMKAHGQELPLPTAVIGVQLQGMTGTPEYSYRVDEGFWHVYSRANGDGELSIADPLFLIQGQHVIEVRSRTAEDPLGVSAPIPIGFRVDWEPPTVSLQVDRAHNVIQVTAHDVVTPDSALVYAYRVGADGAFSEFGHARPVDLNAVDDAGGFAVRVRDQSGNVGEAVYRASTLALRPDGQPAAGAPTGNAQGGGCSTADGGFAIMSLLGCAGWLWRRRRARF